MLKLIQSFYIMVLIVFHDGLWMVYAEEKVEEEVSCQCISKESLATITSSNISIERSCQNANTNPSIWKRTEQHGRPFGFSIQQYNDRITCLSEGDMKFILENELEMKACISLICKACENAGIPMNGCNDE